MVKSPSPDFFRVLMDNVVIRVTPEYTPPPRNSCTSFNNTQFDIVKEPEAEEASPFTLEIVDPQVQKGSVSKDQS